MEPRMHPNAIILATARLRKVQLTVKAMANYADNPAAIESLWGEFVMAAGAVYSKLEQGSKSNGTSAAWFGKKKHERKSDPLLRYIHQARNADEHGIELITARHNSEITLGPGASATLVATDNHTWTVQDAQGEIQYPQDRVVLVRVHDPRFGDHFDPPDEHLGAPVPNRLPHTIAELALTYLEGLVAEAARLGS